MYSLVLFKFGAFALSLSLSLRVFLSLLSWVSIHGNSSLLGVWSTTVSEIKVTPSRSLIRGADITLDSLFWIARLFFSDLFWTCLRLIRKHKRQVLRTLYEELASTLRCTSWSVGDRNPGFWPWLRPCCTCWILAINCWWHKTLSSFFYMHFLNIVSWVLDHFKSPAVKLTCWCFCPDGNWEFRLEEMLSNPDPAVQWPSYPAAHLTSRSLVLRLWTWNRPTVGRLLQPLFS